MSVNLKGRHFTSVLDFTADEIIEVFAKTRQLKKERMERQIHHMLPDRILAMIFEKPSTRTRVSFEAGIYQLGGTGLYLSSRDLQLGRGETIGDTARVLCRYVDGIMARVFAQNTIDELAKNSTVPVINGLSDAEHPCQVMADLFTMQEKMGRLKGLKLAYIGDGNNVCNSLMYICGKLGVNFISAHPNMFFPKENVVETARALAKESGASIELGADPLTAVKDADAIYTDVWVSMGDESEMEKRLVEFAEFQINSELMSHAKEDAIVLHCLPAHREQEITSDVIDGPNSAVWDEAENRLHVQKALMSMIMR